MTTQDKLNILQVRVLTDFGDNRTVDEVCASIASFALTNNIAFGEILPLVKTIGKDGGFIVELADRKANLTNDLHPLYFSKHTYKQMNELVSFLSLDYDVPEKYVLGIVKTCLTTQDLQVPVKSLLSGWKAEALACWVDYLIQDDHAPDVQDVRTHLRGKEMNHSSYTQAYHELFTELVTLGKEVK